MFQRTLWPVGGALLASALACSSIFPALAAGSVRSKYPNYTDKSTHVSVTIKRELIDKHGSQFFTPSRGKEFFILYLVVHNGGHSNQSWNALDFEAVDQAGQTWDGDAFIPDKYSPSLNSGTMRPGETRAGYDGFEVPVSTKKLEVTWSDGDQLDPPGIVAKYTIH